MNLKAVLLIAAAGVALSGCASWMPSFLKADAKPEFTQASVVPDPPQIVHTVQVVQPWRRPGQLQPKPRPGHRTAKPPKARVEAANLAALQEPASDGYVNAIQVYPSSEGALSRLYAAPQEVSDIALQPG